MSFHSADGSQEIKPQSIVHHIGRLGSRIAKPIKKRNRRRRQRKLRDGSIKSSANSTQSASDNSSIMSPETIISIAPSLDCPVAISDDDDGSFISGAGPDYDHTSDQESFFSDIEEGELEDEEEAEGLFETLNQNEFLLECFLTNEQSDVIFLVHFFNQETSISDAVEDVLSLRVLETKSKVECRRIDSKSAPLFTAKLQIDPEQPTVVAIKNGKVLSKVSNVSTAECTEVNQWLTRTKILQNNTSNDTFSSVSTCI